VLLDDALDEASIVIREVCNVHCGPSLLLISHLGKAFQTGRDIWRTEFSAKR
jgi:hypothetical protein